MLQQKTDSDICAPASRSKLAVRKARAFYIAAPDKHTRFTGSNREGFYKHVRWHTLSTAKCVPMHGLTVIPFDIKSARSTTPEYVKAVSKLVELLELPGGWNSYKAKPVNKENVITALGLLAQLMRDSTPAPQVVPMIRSGVQLEWHKRGVDVEITIESPDDISFFAEDRRGELEPVEGAFDAELLKEWIGRLSE